MLMNDISLTILFISLAVLIAISAFFSGSETSMMSINRYRLRNLKNKGNPEATRVHEMLQNTDTLISTILLGNNFVNILASSIATIIGIKIFGDAGIAIATGSLTFIILIFAEITPKTIASAKPEKFAFPASIYLMVIIKILSPFVWVLNLFTSNILKLLNIDYSNSGADSLNKEELRTAVVNSKSIISNDHYQMLLGILDLEKLTVEDIMIPRHEIDGIDIDNPPDIILEQLKNSKHTRMPVYNGDISQCLGMIHSRDTLRIIQKTTVTKQDIIDILRESLYVLSNSLLDEQLAKMQQKKRRTAFVVDEYGELLGLITLEDIVEEIIGSFTTNVKEPKHEVHIQEDGSYIIDCTILVRELNQELNINLPISSNAKTLNGLLLLELEDIPKIGTSLKISGILIGNYCY